MCFSSFTVRFASNFIVPTAHAAPGSAIYVFGSANCSYDVTVDSTTVGSGLTSKTNLLFSTTGLSLGTHFLNLTAHASNQQQLALDSAVVSDALPNGYGSPV